MRASIVQTLSGWAHGSVLEAYLHNRRGLRILVDEHDSDKAVLPEGGVDADLGGTGSRLQECIARGASQTVHHLKPIEGRPYLLAIRRQHGIAVHLGPVDVYRSGFDQHRVSISDPERFDLRMLHLHPGSDSRRRKGQFWSMPLRAILAVVIEHGDDDCVEIGFRADEQAGFIQGLVVGWKQRLRRPLERDEIQARAGILQDLPIPLNTPQYRRPRRCVRVLAVLVPICLCTQTGIRRNGECRANLNRRIHGLHGLGECLQVLGKEGGRKLWVAFELAKVLWAAGSRGMEIGIAGVIGAIEAIVIDLVANLPEPESEWPGMLNAQEIQAVVAGERGLAAKRGPVAHRAPILAGRVLPQRARVGRISIGISDPGGGLGWFAAPGAVQVCSVIDNNHSLAQFFGEEREAAEVALRGKVACLRALIAGGRLCGPMVEIRHSVIARVAHRGDSSRAQVRCAGRVEGVAIGHNGGNSERCVGQNIDGLGEIDGYIRAGLASCWCAEQDAEKAKLDEKSAAWRNQPLIESLLTVVNHDEFPSLARARRMAAPARAKPGILYPDWPRSRSPLPVGRVDLSAEVSGYIIPGFAITKEHTKAGSTPALAALMNSKLGRLSVPELPGQRADISSRYGLGSPLPCDCSGHSGRGKETFP